MDTEKTQATQGDALTSFNSWGVATLESGKRVNVQFTGRHGVSAADMFRDFDNYVNFLELCDKFGVEFWAGNSAGKEAGKGSDNGATVVSSPKVTAQENAPETPAPDKPKRSYNDPVPQGELPVELSEVTVDVFKADFDFFIVEPKPDSKASVKFFKDNLEFAVGGQINNWKNETVSQFLAPMGEIDPSKAEKHRVAGEVYWVKGASYTIATGAKKGQTGNYKDIKLVQAVF